MMSPAAARRHWLVKSEPDTFSFDDLLASPKRTTGWDGVRNYQARNFMRDGMQRGDLVFFYHSSTEPTAIVGVAEVAREAYPDPTALDPKHPHFDPKSDADAPSWMMVDLRAVEPLARPVTLAELKGTKGLERMVLLQKGSRLSVQPVSPEEWKIVYALGMKGR
jgi:predicted RNA-binding protein with PUA-like domain